MKLFRYHRGDPAQPTEAHPTLELYVAASDLAYAHECVPSGITGDIQQRWHYGDTEYPVDLVVMGWTNWGPLLEHLNGMSDNETVDICLSVDARDISPFEQLLDHIEDTYGDRRCPLHTVTILFGDRRSWNSLVGRAILVLEELGAMVIAPKAWDPKTYEGEQALLTALHRGEHIEHALVRLTPRDKWFLARDNAKGHPRKHRTMDVMGISIRLRRRRNGSTGRSVIFADIFFEEEGETNNTARTRYESNAYKSSVISCPLYRNAGKDIADPRSLVERMDRFGLLIAEGFGCEVRLAPGPRQRRSKHEKLYLEPLRMHFGNGLGRSLGIAGGLAACRFGRVEDFWARLALDQQN